MSQFMLASVLDTEFCIKLLWQPCKVKIGSQKRLESGANESPMLPLHPGTSIPGMCNGHE